MTTALYLLMAALAFFVIGYILAKTGCDSGERYLTETPVDPVTADDGRCEDEEILAAQKEAKDAETAEAQRIQETSAQEAAAIKEKEVAKEKEEIAAKARAQAEEAAKHKADEKAQKEREAKASADSKEKEKIASEQKEKTSASVTETEMQESAAMAPEGLLDAPRDGKKDNLTRIKGVGIKIDEALNSIGIWHFDQIAAWTEENMVWADRELAFPGRAKRDDWVGQAKLLAKGKETEFSKRVDKGEVASSKKV